MMLLRFVSIGLVSVGGVDAWRRILGQRRGLAADAAILAVGVATALLASFEGIFWVVLLVFVLPIVGFIWSPIPETRQRPKTQPQTASSDQTKGTNLLEWGIVVAAAGVLLAGLAGIGWNRLATVARLGVLLFLGGVFVTTVVLILRARRFYR
jgi:4-hydroxybenzoate polyprenyltransferase